MRRTFGIATAAALTIAAIATWATASIHSDAALKTLGPMAIEAQIDIIDLMKTAQNLPAEKFDAY